MAVCKQHLGAALINEPKGDNVSMAVRTVFLVRLKPQHQSQSPGGAHLLGGREGRPQLQLGRRVV